MNRILKTGIFILVLGLLQSCYWDNAEDLYPMVQECDTSNVTYAATISIIMENNCNACHNSSFPQGGVIVDNYTDLKVVVDNGRFWGALNHEDGYSPMPQNMPKLNECNLSKIRVWIDQGALDN